MLGIQREKIVVCQTVKVSFGWKKCSFWGMSYQFKIYQ